MAEHAEEALAARLVETYSDRLLRLAYSILNSVPDAQDVCQEVLLKRLEYPGAFENEKHEQAWMARVTVNACKNVRRSPWRTRTVGLDAVAEPAAFQPEEGGVLEEVQRFQSTHPARGATANFTKEQRVCLAQFAYLHKGKKAEHTKTNAPMLH